MQLIFNDVLKPCKHFSVILLCITNTFELSVHRQMTMTITITIARKEGERKTKSQPLAVETERRKEQTFSRR